MGMVSLEWPDPEDGCPLEYDARSVPDGLGDAEFHPVAAPRVRPTPLDASCPVIPRSPESRPGATASNLFLQCAVVLLQLRDHRFQSIDDDRVRLILLGEPGLVRISGRPDPPTP